MAPPVHPRTSAGVFFLEGISCDAFSAYQLCMPPPQTKPSPVSDPVLSLQPHPCHGCCVLATQNPGTEPLHMPLSPLDYPPIPLGALCPWGLFALAIPSVS